MDNTKEKKRPFQALIRRGAYDGPVSAALIGAVIGMLAGMLPATAWAIVFGRVAYALYAVPPLAMFIFIALLGGCRDIRAIIVMAALSLLGAYLTAVSAEAAAYAMSYDMPALSVPLMAVSSIGKAEFLPKTASGYAFPLLFTALGAALASELLLSSGCGEAW